MNKTINNNGFGKDVGARRISRILAIQGVYSYLYAEEKNSEIIDYLSEQELYSSADIIFFEDIFNNTLKNIVELRELIEPFLNISVERLSKVEEAVMLVATYELKERIDIPLKTIINEAVEVDKCLGSNDGHRIVNGVLDKIAKKLKNWVLEGPRAFGARQETQKNTGNNIRRSPDGPRKKHVLILF